MANFPSVFSSFNQTTPTSKLNAPSHSALHNTVSSAVGQLEAVIGRDGDNSVLGTIIGDLRSPNSGGGGHVQTANKGGTGQTAFNKGDVLVASSSSVLTKLTVGSDGQALVANSGTFTGVNWATTAIINVQSFVTAVPGSSLFTWAKPNPAGTVARIQAWGGGGAGGTGANGSYGGGGGGGAYSEVWYPTSLLGATEQVRIGGGGASVSGATIAGGAGSNTIFGASSIVIAYGGGGGGSGDTNSLSSPSGGGGGGTMGSGTTGNNATGGSTAPSVQGGAPLFYGNSDNALGGGNGSASNGKLSWWGGGGGGAAGGRSWWGGGGGSNGTTSPTAGGVSQYGGYGGDAGDDGKNGSAGSVAGGGGGGAFSSTTSGRGGDGKVIVTVF